jgi:hypothetical protein
MRGAAMTPHQSEARRDERLRWLEKFGFIVPDLEALISRGMRFDNPLPEPKEVDGKYWPPCHGWGLTYGVFLRQRVL